MDTDGRVEATLKQFVAADLRLKAVVEAVQSAGERRCWTLAELVEREAEARECTREMRRLLACLEALAGEEENELRRAAFLRNVDNYAAQLHQAQLHLRRAVLAAKQRLESREREELLTPAGGAARRRPVASTEGRGAAMAAEVTGEMRALSSALASQVESSKATMEQLLHSSGTITETRREYEGMSGHIERSSRLLTKLNRREMTDRVVLILAFLFFFITCAYIVKKRLWGSSAEPTPA